ncbi:MAG: efflux RND transporter periplasmic adaptor subunit [Streptococcus gallolyticus]|nr:efflux RND transporter periplasmic adaptor subunit [Streptococcus gallolyticus]
MVTRSKGKFPKNKKIIALSSLIAIVLVGGGIYFYQKSGLQASPASEVVEAVPVRDAVGDSQKINGILSGEVEANNSSKVKIDPSKGEVKEVYVKAGDNVTAGQPLFSYETDQALTAQSANYDVQSKQAAASAARSTADVKWATYTRKLNSFNQLNTKFKQGGEDAPSAADLKSAQDDLDQALADAQTSENEAKTAQIEYEKAQATAATENEKLKYDTVTADTDGTVTTLNENLRNQSKEKKEKETFMEIVDRSKYFVRGEVSEMDRDKVSVGQRVMVLNRKDSTKSWLGTITQVGDLTANSDSSSDGKENPNMSKYPYKVELDQSENQPSVGIHTYVKLVDSSTEVGKLILNKKYLITEKNKTYIWKVEGNKIKRQEVTVQKLSDSLYEVTAGLGQDDTIALPKEGMKEGMEVGQNVES